MQLAQLNIAKMLYADDDPRMSDFFDNIDRINALGESSEGFVWRYADESGGATETRPFGDDWLVNITVWTDIPSLKAFVYKTGHSDFVRRRGEWFQSSKSPSTVMWWVEDGHQPTPVEAVERYEHLVKHGPSPYAFTFARTYQPGE